MFQSARIKLTLWYLIIIMLISLSFSAVIYKSVMMELDRFENVQRYRIERQLEFIRQIPYSLREQFPPPSTSDLDLIDETRKRFVVYLVLINTGIAAMTGVLGYFLAGKTLQPIQVMVDEQRRFIGDASHELRTPLTALKTSLEVNLRDTHLDINSARQVITDALHDVNRLQTLSDQLLELAQYEKPLGSFNLEKIDLSTVLKNAVRTITPLAKAKKITIHTKYQDTLVYGNTEALTHLFIILLENAIKYSHDKGEIYLESMIQNNNKIVTVSDRGIGMDTKDLGHIFDRFYRADEARTHNSEGGYGLGLSIAKRIINTHNAHVDIQSTKGRGTSISIRFIQ